METRQPGLDGAAVDRIDRRADVLAAPGPQADHVNFDANKDRDMLRLLGLNPIARAVVGVGLLAIGLGTNRLLLTIVGAVVLAVSAITLLPGSKTRSRDR